ncbi:MAG: hypothetical protein ACFFD9_09985, partial [Candidatus Thorarchaeota archaeon]
MAEEFLKRLTGIEKSIAALDDTLKRMITILGAMTEIRSDIRMAKDELLDAVTKTSNTGGESGVNMEEIAALIKGQFDTIGKFINDAIEGTRDDLFAALKEISAPAPAVAARKAAAPAPKQTSPEVAAAPQPTSVIVSADKAMKIANEIDKIIASLKMG